MEVPLSGLGLSQSSRGPSPKEILHPVVSREAFDPSLHPRAPAQIGSSPAADRTDRPTDPHGLATDRALLVVTRWSVEGWSDSSARSMEVLPAAWRRIRRLFPSARQGFLYALSGGDPTGAPGLVL